MKKSVILALILSLTLSMSASAFAANSQVYDSPVGVSNLQTPSIPWNEELPATIFSNAGTKTFTATATDGKIDLGGGAFLNAKSAVSAVITKGTTVIEKAVAQTVVSNDTLTGFKFSITPKDTSSVSSYDTQINIVIKNIVDGSVETTEIPLSFTIAPNMMEPDFEIDADGNFIITLSNGKEVITKEIIEAAKGSKLTVVNGQVSLSFDKVNSLTPINLGVSLSDPMGLMDVHDEILEVVTFKASGSKTGDKAKVSVDLGYDFVNENGRNGYYVYFVDGKRFVGVASGLVAEQSSLSFNLIENRLGTYVITQEPIKGAVGGTEEEDKNDDKKPTVTNPETGATTAIASALGALALSTAAAVAVSKKRNSK